MGVQNAQPLRSGWSQVLGISQDEVQFGDFGLPLVAKLVASASAEAVRAEEEVSLPLRDELVAEWSKPVYAPGTNLDGPIHQQSVSSEALAYLHSVANVLQRRDNHEALPEGDELTELLDQVGDLADSIDASTELPDDVRRPLLRRVAHVRFAIENARVAGSEGVQQAVELLVGALWVRADVVPTWTRKKILTVAAIAFAVFSSGTTIQANLEAWSQVAETLRLGTGGTQGTGHADEQQEDQQPPADKAEG